MGRSIKTQLILQQEYKRQEYKASDMLGYNDTRELWHAQDVVRIKGGAGSW